MMIAPQAQAPGVEGQLELITGKKKTHDVSARAKVNKMSRVW